MFFSRNKKNNVDSCKPQFYNIKVGIKGVKIIWACFRDDSKILLFRPLEIKTSPLYLLGLKVLNSNWSFELLNKSLRDLNNCVRTTCVP